MEVDAVLVQADRISSSVYRGSGGKTHVKYDYQYDGKKYEGSQVMFGGILALNAVSSSTTIQEFVDRLNAQLKASPDSRLNIKTWVDPANPKNSALMNSVHPMLHYLTIFALCSVGIGVINAVFTLKERK